MSTLDFEGKALVGILAGAVALIAVVNVLKPDTRVAGVQVGRTVQVTSLRSEPPHYAIRYTFPRVPKECLVDNIAAKDQARCEMELARRPAEDVRLVAPKSTFALKPGNTIPR